MALSRLGQYGGPFGGGGAAAVSTTPLLNNNGLVFDFVRAQSTGGAVWASRVSQYADFAVPAYVDGVRETLYVRLNSPQIFRLHVTESGTIASRVRLPWTARGATLQKFEGLTVPYGSTAPVDVYVRYASNMEEFEGAAFSLVQTLPAGPGMDEPARVLVGVTTRWYQVEFRCASYGMEIYPPIELNAYETQRMP